jgi:fumarate reductase subunit C
MSEPQAYQAPVSTWWWLKKRTYFVFVMRELSSVFVAWFAVFLMLMIAAIGRGQAAYDDFVDWAATPWVVVVNVVALLFLVLHTITWFALTPQAMAVRLGDRRVPGWMIIASQYIGLAIVSAFVVWLVTR